MHRVPKRGDPPKWISEFLPVELIDSTLFRFEIRLQTVAGFKCEVCGASYDYQPTACTAIVDDMACGGTPKAYRKSIIVDLLPDLALDYEIIEDQMQTLPAQYAFWASVYSEARLQVANEERRLKATRGRLIEEAQKEQNLNKVRVSQELVKNIVEADKSLIEADKRLQMAHVQCGKLFHMLEALKMKAELIRSLAGFKRQELDKS